MMTDSKFLARLGGKIKSLRQLKALTQNELATLCNFENASMSRIESGKTNISILTLRKISKALNVEMEDFFKY